MAKPKLSLQQQQRIAQRQAKAVRSGNELDLKTGIVLAQFGKELQLTLADQPDQVLVAKIRASLPKLVTGDRVWFRQNPEQQAIIEHLQPRSSILTRPDHRGKLKEVAANIDLMVIVASLYPETPINLIDRYLVAAKICQIQPLLVLNKTDLEAGQELGSFFPYYQQRLGILSLHCSHLDQASITKLQQQIASKTSILVGLSGAGKSSLIHALTQEDSIRVAAVSNATGKGKHTTTTTQLYFHHDSMIIDSPGVRDFSLEHATLEQIKAGFPDIQQLAMHCRFNNCSHLHEPDCAVKNASPEKLHPLRWQSYMQILNSISNK